MMFQRAVERVGQGLDRERRELEPGRDAGGERRLIGVDDRVGEAADARDTIGSAP